MIVGERKSLEEIKAAVKDCKKILILGCGTCVSVCMAGGKKEVALLASQLRMAATLDKKDVQIDEDTLQRQCDREYIEPVLEKAREYDAVISMACGAGVQLLAEMLMPLYVTPGLNTTFIGITEREGTWLERCKGCGDCLLGVTGGVCPVARCAKSLFNGPCGGSNNGMCEVSPDTPCAWQSIYDALKAADKLERLEEIQPVRDWKNSGSGVPRRIIREDAVGV